MRLLKLSRHLVIITLLATLSACEKPVPIVEEAPTIEVTYDTIEGDWELTHINGEELINDSMLYIRFTNSDKPNVTHRYEMWDNIGSMYLVQTTGTYTITQEGDNYILSGTYDNGLGDWNERYSVVMVTDSRMQWRAKSGTCLEFKYAMVLPEEFY
ncbi:MAG: lipocalin family protein [Alistipes sp.]|nr:lipocalin family protein [Alistipes sp.]